MRLSSLVLGAAGFMASLIGTMVVAEQDHARTTTPDSLDLGGCSQRYIARFAHKTSQETSINTLFTGTTQLSRSSPMATHSTSLTWGGSRSQRFVARYAQITPVSNVRRQDDQAAAQATSLPLCCFNEGKGQYDCPCRKTSNDKTHELDQLSFPPQACNRCWSAIQECHKRCDGDEDCDMACTCDTCWEIPMCRRCPWAVRECGTELTGGVVGAREEPLEAITSDVDEVMRMVLPTTLATVVARGQRKCKCMECGSYRNCRYVPCTCGSSGAVDGEAV